VGHFPRTVLRGHGSNFTSLAENIGSSSMITEFVSDFRYLGQFGNDKASGVEHLRPNFALFDPV